MGRKVLFIYFVKNIFAFYLQYICIVIIFASELISLSNNLQIYIMKKKGSVVEFTRQRDEELLAAFRAQLSMLGEIPLNDLFTRAAMSPASRFWVSERRAMIVISRMMKGDQLSSMNRKRREMFFEIFHRVKEILRRQPELSLTEASFRAVNSPAPQFYLTPKSARAMIYRLRA